MHTERNPTRCLPLAAFGLVATLLTQGCSSVTVWRSCAAPCTGKQFDAAHGIEVCTRNGIPYVFERARWGEDEHGAFLAGKASTRLGQPLGKVKIYARDIDLMYTLSLSGGRVLASAVLAPVVLALGEPVDNDHPVLDEDDSIPRSCPPPEARAASAGDAGGAAATTEPAPSAQASPASAASPVPQPEPPPPAP